MKIPSLSWIERVAKIINPLGIALAVALIPVLFNMGVKDREIALEYSKIAISILQNQDTAPDKGKESALRKWATSILKEVSPVSLGPDLEKQLTEGSVSLPEEIYSSIDLIRKGQYIEVSPKYFVPVVAATEQLSKKEIEDFVDAAHTLFKAESQRAQYTWDNRWSIDVGGGREVFIFRTRDEFELERAVHGVYLVLEAIKEERDLEGVKINLRGTERFYDIEGLAGLGTRAWIGFDLR